ncbi:MAG: PhoX family phosphatase [Methylobacteriaceae bacterium]|nr:PhoX family phosphatase [Methylobacteriaceae bacterium]
MTDHLANTRSRSAELADDIGANDSANTTIGDVIAARLARRDFLRGSLAATVIGSAVSPLAMSAARAQGTAPQSRFAFKELAAGADEQMHVAEGYDAQVLIRWGDKVTADAPPFDPRAQTGAAQDKQFGYNNDFLGYFPIDGGRRGLLCVNHEYTNEELMFPAIGRQDVKDVRFKGMTAEMIAVEMAAHAGSVIEVARGADGKWTVVEGSKYARRITANTAMEITGPAAGDARMKTSADPDGKRVLGMLNNCAGGVTPWGTWLNCEENFNGYFSGAFPADSAEGKSNKRYNLPSHGYDWGRHHARFDVTKEPNEPNRFGWVVEIDPFDPASTPKKRTALGRFKHEGAAGIVNKDGRYAIYQGDDERFDYVYRFVTEAKVDTTGREGNRDILDRGVLSVARFDADGSGVWMPLVHGQGKLTAENGFRSQADVVIEARRAADLLGATKMDRPEDVEANPKTNKVYVMLTNNVRRKADQIDAANPRAENRFGHILEITPPDGDHAAANFRWEILVRCGDPSIAAVGATFNPATTKDGWFGMPDNCAIDADGRLWIATDGNSRSKTGRNDGLWALETEGPLRGASKLFFTVPNGAEMCGPCPTPDGETFFVAVQHPGEADEDDPKAEPATFEKPSTRWPDFRPDMPPRPSVVAITRKGGGKIA